MLEILDKICTPTRGTIASAGIDLYTREEVVVKQFEQTKIPLGVKFKLRSSIRNGEWSDDEYLLHLIVGNPFMYLIIKDSDGNRDDEAIIKHVNLLVRNPNYLYKIKEEFPEIIRDLIAKLPELKARELANKDTIEMGTWYEQHKNKVCLLLPRSSAFGKFGITLVNSVGVIDIDFPNEWMGMVTRLPKGEVTISKGTKLFQAILLKHNTDDFGFTSTVIREDGFGSTDLSVDK